MGLAHINTGNASTAGAEGEQHNGTGTGSAAAADKDKDKGDMDNLRAAQSSHRQQHIVRLQDENSRMVREVDELRQLLQPHSINHTAKAGNGEEEKEQTE